MEKILNYIGGEWREPRSGKFLENDNPSRGKPYSLVPDSDESDVNDAVEAAKRAFPAWSALPTEDRTKILRKVADGIGAQLEALALAESTDNGKPISVSRTVDIPRSQLNLEFYSDCATQFHGESYISAARGLNYTVHSPLGVVGCISPWNLPLYLLTWKIAPALAVGDTVVAKPSEVTPMTAYLFTRIAAEAGLPPGVLNIVHGVGGRAGAALTQHADIKAVSFTGSTATGRAVAETTAKTFKKVSLEMGGKNPNIVFADCDFELAVESSVRAAFANQGQICLCGSRVFVEESIYGRFKEAVVAKAKALRVGDPLDPKTEQGALVSRVHRDKVVSYLELAKKEGGTFLCGGGPAKLSGELAEGYFVAPTWIEGLSSQCRTNQEEIFGPVASLIPFRTEDEAIAMANSTRYGLTASLWTSDLKRANRVASRLESGVVWINTWMLRDLRTPFGGVKESGVGREGGLDALRFFTEVKNVCIGL